MISNPDHTAWGAWRHGAQLGQSDSFLPGTEMNRGGARVSLGPGLHSTCLTAWLCRAFWKSEEPVSFQ